MSRKITLMILLQNVTKCPISLNMADLSRKSHLDRTIGNRVRDILSDRNLPVETFAKSAGIDGGQFRRLLKGAARWNTWHLDVVAEKLGISLIDLIRQESENKEDEEAVRFVRKFFLVLKENIEIDEHLDITLLKAYQFCRDTGQDIESICFKARQHLVMESREKKPKNPASNCG